MFVLYMDKVLKDIVDKPLALKLTSGAFSHDLSTKFERADRVQNYYMEGNKKFTWMKKWKGNVFIYGDPFPSYSGF